MIEHAHEEDGHLVPAEDFDYAAVDLSLFPNTSVPSDLSVPTQLTDREMEAALALCDQVFRWTWQDAMRNPDGLKIRAAIACWIFLKPLRPLNLTQLARGFGLHKQSVGRWVDDFKLRFPHIRTPHMR